MDRRIVAQLFDSIDSISSFDIVDVSPDYEPGKQNVSEENEPKNKSVLESHEPLIEKDTKSSTGTVILIVATNK